MTGRKMKATHTRGRRKVHPIVTKRFGVKLFSQTPFITGVAATFLFSTHTDLHLLVSNEDHDFILILLFGDCVSSGGAKPLFQRVHRPTGLIGAASGLHEQHLVSVAHRGHDQMPVESPQPRDVRVDVVDEAHFEHGVCKTEIKIN